MRPEEIGGGASSLVSRARGIFPLVELCPGAVSGNAASVFKCDRLTGAVVRMK